MRRDGSSRRRTTPTDVTDSFPLQAARSTVHFPAESPARPVAIVLGSDEIASAIAHRLHCEGWGVVLIDRVDPPVCLRGMAFADSWYYGVAELAGVHAVFCASVRSIPTALRKGASVAATTWSWSGVAASLDPVVTIDTRKPSERTSLHRATAPMRMIELGAGVVTAPEFHVPVPPARLALASNRTTANAPHGGRFAPLRSIGDALRAGDRVGMIDTTPVVATTHGILLGVTARGARVRAGDPVAVVDPRVERHDCFGLDGEGTRIAAAVMLALEEQAPGRATGRRPR